MEVVDLSISKKKEEENKLTYVDDTIRGQILEYAKDFKTSWLNLGRHIYSVWQDKLYHAWGYDKFEDYTEKELGITKQISMKLFKAYIFIEEDEPSYLKPSFRDDREPHRIPDYDAVNVLRLAKNRKELNKDDYQKLRSEVFERGSDASAVRKELTALIKERKQVDPDEEREQRSQSAIKKAFNALVLFKKDMETLKLIPGDILEEAKELMNKLEQQID